MKESFITQLVRPRCLYLACNLHISAIRAVFCSLGATADVLPRVVCLVSARSHYAEAQRMQSQSRAKVQGVYSEAQVISQTGEKQQEYEENTGEGGQRGTAAGHQEVGVTRLHMNVFTVG